MSACETRGSIKENRRIIRIFKNVGTKLGTFLKQGHAL